MLLKRSRNVDLKWIVVTALAMIAIAGCGARTSDLSFETQPRPVLTTEGAQPTRTPQISVAPSGMLSLLAVYGEGATQRVGFTMSHDGGDHFMPLKPISDDGVTISAHGENNPVMATAGRGVYAVWEQSQADGARDLVLARSINEGMSFEKPVRINDNKTPSFHGFASIAADAKGNVYVVWLDGREPPENPGTFEVYLAHSSDRGATFAPNVRVSRSACPCCRPNVTIGPNGDVYVVWRKVFPGSIRDMVLSVSKDGGQTFPQQARVAEDGWQINGCPESGAALTVFKNRLYLGWMTAGSDSHARIQLAASTDGGQHFSAPLSASQEIRDPNHPTFAQGANGKLLLCFQGRPQAKDDRQWSTAAAFVEELRDGAPTKPTLLANSGDTVSYPDISIGATGNIYATWTATANGKAAVYLLRGNFR